MLLPHGLGQASDDAPEAVTELELENQYCLELLTASQQGQHRGMEYALTHSGSKGGQRASAEALLCRAVRVCSWLENSGDFEKARALARLALSVLERKTETEEASAEVLYWESHLLGTYLGREADARALAGEGRKRWPEQDRFVELEYALIKKQKARRK